MFKSVICALEYPKSTFEFDHICFVTIFYLSLPITLSIILSYASTDQYKYLQLSTS